MSIGFFSGSFDPFTNGHLEIVKKASKLFDKLIIGIGINISKKRTIDQKEMLSTIQKIINRENIKNVEVKLYEILAVDFAKQNNVDFFVRGLRNNVDFSYEEDLANVNLHLLGIDTVYFRPTDYSYISSSMVRELFHFKKDISGYVPHEVLELMNKQKNN